MLSVAIMLTRLLIGKFDCVDPAKNELLIDIVTVYDYFVREIYGNRNVKIELMISTCQNYKNLKEYEDKQN